jgi:hypothetical protein
MAGINLSEVARRAKESGRLHSVWSDPCVFIEFTGPRADEFLDDLTILLENRLSGKRRQAIQTTQTSSSNTYSVTRDYLF